MKRSFWKELKKPFFVLAPMHEVTDIAFRQIVISCGKPDVLVTEFVSCAGLCSSGHEKLLPSLRYEQNEHPIVAQVFGTDPKQFESCARLIRELGFDGIDINMGCPDRKVLKQGAGAALIKNPSLAKKIIAATRTGARSTSSGQAGDLPVSVKTRLGYAKLEFDTWIKPLLEAEPDALTIHGRTVKELSKVPAHWDLIREVATMAHERNIIVVGNGDVTSREQGIEYANRYGVDGIMIGRGIFGNPWIFNPRAEEPTKEERIKLLVEHTKLFERYWGTNQRNFDTLKKFFKMYVSGWHGAVALRAKLMQAHTLEEVYAIVAPVS